MVKTIRFLAAAALLSGAALANAATQIATNFESNTVGSIVGQTTDGRVWQDFSAPNQPAPQIVDLSGNPDPLMSVHGKVLDIQPTGTLSTDFSGAFLPLDELITPTNKLVTIDFDQYRVPLSEELYIGENAEDFPTGWDAREHGLNGRIYPTDDLLGAPSLPLIANAWQHVQLKLDFTTQMVTMKLDSQSVGPTPFETLQPTFRGLALYAFATSRPPNEGPNYFDNLSITTDGEDGAVPEPASLALLATGLLPLAWRRRARV